MVVVVVVVMMMVAVSVVMAMRWQLRPRRASSSRGRCNGMQRVAVTVLAHLELARALQVGAVHLDQLDLTLEPRREGAVDRLVGHEHAQVDPGRGSALSEVVQLVGPARRALGVLRDLEPHEMEQ